MNEAQFLLALGMKVPSESTDTLGCPAYHHDRKMPTPSAMVETTAEVDAHIQAFKSPAHRAFPSRGPGAKTV